jgi:hypothetical protein
MNVWHSALLDCGYSASYPTTTQKIWRILPNCPRPCPRKPFVANPVNRVRVFVELILRAIRVTNHGPLSDFYIMEYDASVLRCASGTCSRHVNTRRPASNVIRIRISTIPSPTWLRLGCRSNGRCCSRGGCRRYCRSDGRGNGRSESWPHSRRSCRRATCCEANCGDRSADDGCEFHVCCPSSTRPSSWPVQDPSGTSH